MKAKTAFFAMLILLCLPFIFAASSSSSINWLTCGGLADGVCPYAYFETLTVINKTTVNENITGSLDVEGNITADYVFADYIGIGTTAPDVELDVSGGAEEVEIQLENSVRRWQLEADNSPDDFRLRDDSLGAPKMVVEGGNGGDVYFTTSIGNFGIGTTSPDTILHLKTDQPAIKLNDSDDVSHAKIFFNEGHLRLYSDEDNLEAGSTINFHVDDNEVMTIDGGNVGIGTTAPAHKLEVAGSMNVSGDLNVSGTLYGGSPLDIGSDTTVDGNLNVSGIINASKYYGDGSGLTGISGDGTGGWVNDSASTYTDKDVNMSNKIKLLDSYDIQSVPSTSGSTICSADKSFTIAFTNNQYYCEEGAIHTVQIQDTSPGCDFEGNCWNGYTTAFLYLPDGLSTSSTNPISLNNMVTTYSWTVTCTDSNNYLIVVEFGTSSNCSMNYEWNLTGYAGDGIFQINDEWLIYSNSIGDDLFIKNTGLDGYSIRFSGDSGILNLEDGFEAPQISMKQGNSFSGTLGHFNLSFVGSDSDKTGTIALSDVNVNRIPTLNITLDKQEKVVLNNTKMRFSVDLAFSKNSTYDIGSPSAAIKDIYYETAHDLTPGWDDVVDGSAMTAITNINTINGEIDHSTLPAFARGTFYCKGEGCEETDSYLTEAEQIAYLSTKLGIDSKVINQTYAKTETRKTNHLLTALVEAQKEMGIEMCKLGSYEWC